MFHAIGTLTIVVYRLSFTLTDNEVLVTTTAVQDDLAFSHFNTSSAIHEGQRPGLLDKAVLTNSGGGVMRTHLLDRSSLYKNGRYYI